MPSLSQIILTAFALFVNVGAIRSDPGSYGPKLEVAHLYYGQWPTGITVSQSGRMFSNFPAGLDANNTSNGKNGKFQVAELLKGNKEKAYPSLAFNTPPGGAVNKSTTPPTSANYDNHLIGVQSVVIDEKDRLWIVDTGRTIDPASGLLLNAVLGGPKLVAVDLKSDKIIKTIKFPSDVAYPDSYLNDVRFDLGRNYAYLTDSSTEGRNGIVIVNLSTGKSWRHLNGDPRVHPEGGFVPFVWGQPLYGYMPGQPAQYVPFGSDGIALSADGNTLYFTPLSSRTLYSIPTARLRDNSPYSETRAQGSVTSHGQKGVTDGMETDSNNMIYIGSQEQSAIVTYDPAKQAIETFVRDPRMSWVDTMSVSTSGYLYFTANQLSFTPQIYPGTDRRKHPYVLFRAKLPNGGKKVSRA